MKLVAAYKSPVHTTTEKFENRCFTLKAHEMFSTYTSTEQFERVTMTGHFEFVFEGNLDKKIVSRYLDVIEKQTFSNPSGLKSAFATLIFRDGLVWAVSLTVEM